MAVMAVPCHVFNLTFFYEPYVYLCVDEQWHRAEEKLVYGVENNSTLVECVPRSLQATVLWFLQRGADKLEVSLMGRYLKKYKYSEKNMATQR